MGSWASVVRALASLAVLVSVSQAVAQSPETEKPPDLPAEVAQAFAYFNQGQWREAIDEAKKVEEDPILKRLKKEQVSYRHILRRLQIMKAMAFVELGFTGQARSILHITSREPRPLEDEKWLKVADQEFAWASSKVLRLLDKSLKHKIERPKSIVLEKPGNPPSMPLADVQDADEAILLAFEDWCQGCEDLAAAVEMCGKDQRIQSLAKLEQSQKKLKESQKKFDEIAPQNVIARFRLPCDIAELVAARAMVLAQGAKGDCKTLLEELKQKQNVFDRAMQQCDAEFGVQHPVSRRASVSHVTFCLVAAKAMKDLKTRSEDSKDKDLQELCANQQQALKQELVKALTRLQAAVGPPDAEESLPLQNLYCRDALLLELAALDDGYAVGNVRERSKIIEDIEVAFSKEATLPRDNRPLVK